MQPQHLGLFEGIGGFSLAARWAGYHTPEMVEWNPYCQAVLKKNFPHAHIHGDIHQYTGHHLRGHIHVLTGGFPCQPYSHAGKRAGNNDHRALWPQMLRVIREVAPAWVIGENVAGLLTMDGGRVLSGILTDLENAGYQIEIYSIPALAVGAPHERERIWIVAHTVSAGAGSLSRQAGDQRRTANENRPESLRQTHRQACTNRAQPTDANNVGDIAHSDGIECHRSGRTWERRPEPTDENSRDTFHSNRQRQQQPQGTIEKKWRRTTDENNHHPPHPHLQRCRQFIPPGEPGSPGFHTRSHDAQWNEHWLPVATRLCRVDDGLPARLDRTTPLPTPPQPKKASGRAHRLEALGNAIVPHIAYQIFQAINHHQSPLPNPQ